MKIALVIEKMNPAKGGCETSTSQIAISLAKRDIDVTILCQEGSWKHENVKLITLPADSEMSKKAKRLAFYRDIATHMQNNHYDIIHSMLAIPKANIYQPRSGSIPGQRFASQRRRCFPNNIMSSIAWKFNRLRRLSLNTERKMISNNRMFILPGSEMVADEFRSHYKQKLNIQTVFNAVDKPAYSPEAIADMRRAKRWELNADDNTTVFITIATNWKLKGITETIHAFAKWQKNTNKSARLVAIGEDEPAKYAMLAEKLGVGNIVDFPGNCTNVNPWYAASDACILLSWYDPCSRVILEAASWLIPSITTSYNGSGEALASGAGIVVKSPADNTAIVAAMNELADIAKREQYVSACRKIAGELTTAKHVDKLISVYKKILQTRTLHNNDGK